jgi:hypothetical protein
MARKLNWENEARKDKAKKPSSPITISGVPEPEANKRRLRKENARKDTKYISEDASVQCKKCKHWMKQRELKVHSCIKCKDCGKHIDYKKIRFHKCKSKNLRKMAKKRLRSNKVNSAYAKKRRG